MIDEMSLIRQFEGNNSKLKRVTNVVVMMVKVNVSMNTTFFIGEYPKYTFMCTESNVQKLNIADNEMNT